jgi:hypothetical protein
MDLVEPVEEHVVERAALDLVEQPGCAAGDDAKAGSLCGDRQDRKLSQPRLNVVAGARDVDDEERAPFRRLPVEHYLEPLQIVALTEPEHNERLRGAATAPVNQPGEPFGEFWVGMDQDRAFNGRRAPDVLLDIRREDTGTRSPFMFLSVFNGLHRITSCPKLRAARADVHARSVSRCRDSREKRCACAPDTYGHA